MCKKNGITKEAQIVHHKTPVKDGGAWHDFENLEALCYSCHTKKPGHGRRYK
jgi:5-methylcytosine-specific restriction endonuclease McrA